MIIVTDFDDCLNNLLESWVKWLNEKYCLDVKVSQIVDWEMIKAFPTLTKEQIFYPLETEQFWKTVKSIPDALSVINILRKRGHTVLISTSTLYKNILPKFEQCLFKHFPVFTYKDVIISYHKDLLDVDIIIDDYPPNIKNSKAIRILFDQPYNKNCDKSWYDYRVENWQEILDVILSNEVRDT